MTKWLAGVWIHIVKVRLGLPSLLILLLHALPNSGQSANVLWSLSVEYGMGVYRRRWKVSPMDTHYQPTPRY